MQTHELLDLEARIALRPVTMADAELLWRWVNDPLVREWSFQQEPIPVQTHVAWLRRKLADPNAVIYLAVDGQGKPVGQVRFEIDAGGQAEVDVSVAPTMRGKGYASAVLRRGVAELLRTTAVHRVRAVIKAANAKSIRAFERAGFAAAGTGTVHEQPVAFYVLARPSREAAQG